MKFTILPIPLLVASACAAHHVDRARLAEVRTPGAAAAAKSQIGRVESVLILDSRLVIDRDGLGMVNILRSTDGAAVQLTRRVESVGDRPRIEVEATQWPSADEGDAEETIRYTRVLGSGSIEAERIHGVAGREPRGGATRVTRLRLATAFVPNLLIPEQPLLAEVETTAPSSARAQ